MKNKDYFNIISLALIQISNSLLPLFIFPFILKKIGSVLYSTLVTTETVAVVVLSFVIFSFEINGVSKLIGLNIQRDRNKISQIFSVVFYTRIVIFVVCVCVLLVSFFFLELLTVYIMLAWLLIPLSYIFQSLWFFQGLEKNIYTAIFTVLSRLSCFGLIILLIQDSHDYIMVPFIVGGTYLIGGICSFLFILFKLKIQLSKIYFSQIKFHLIEGKEIFTGNMSVLLFRDLNVFLMSILSVNPVSISIYSITEKLIKGLQATTRPLNQFFFPRVISKLKGIERPNRKALKIILKQTIPQLTILLIINISIWILFKYINIYTILLNNYPQKDQIYKLFIMMNVAIYFGVVNFMIGSTGLNFLNEKKYLFKSLFMVGFLSLLISLLLVPIIQEFGVAFSFVFSEFCLLIFIIKKYNITEK